MGVTTFRPSKGREIQDLTTKLNELIDAVNSFPTAQGGTKNYQNIGIVKNPDGTHALQIRTSDGVIQSDNTSATGFKKL